MAEIRDDLIAAGIVNLRAAGCKHVTSENILTDTVYRDPFKTMLEEKLGDSLDAEINALLAEIEAA